MLENLYSILLIFGLILLNGSFVAAEFAIARVRKTHIDQIVESENNSYSPSQIQAAKILQKMIVNINDYISACQVGITIASLSLGAVAEARIEKWITPLIHQFALPLDEHVVSIIIAISIITFFHVILGEVVPKNIAIINAEETSLNLAYFLRALYWLFKFPVHVLNTCANLVLRLLGVELNFDDTAHSEAELKMILSSSQAQGVLEAEEEQLMQNVFHFNDTIARDVMVPRSDLVCLNDKLSIAEAAHETNKTTFTRFPVYHEKIDNIVGYISIKDILKSYETGNTDNNIKSIANDALKVTDGMYLIDLIKVMQENKKPVAMLIDEFGGVTGLVTIEDIVEEIFGEIDDEDEEETYEIQELANGDYLIDGLTNLEDINEALGSHFKSSRFDTIGGYIFGQIGTEPKIGDTIQIDGYTLCVEQHGKNRVREVRVSKI
ncbi:MAG: hemolysin family protein [Cyanobacteria bacterium]|nr:hemolysin family protein [Cyanobacteriota bacterium]MDA1020233.1 hemolysin family protein [Cyanobacteriota bacterium]